MNLRTAIATIRIKSAKRFATVATVGTLGLTACGGDSTPDTFEARSANRAALATEAERYVDLQESRAAEATSATDARSANRAALTAEAERYVELQKSRGAEAESSLFGNLTGAEAGTPGDPAAEPAMGRPTADAAATSATVTLSPRPAASGGPASNAGLPTITCRITVTTPDEGGLQVYTWGEVTCNYPISEIGLYVELTRNGQVERYDQRVRVDTAGFALQNVAPCAGGVWRAFAWAHLLAPPGYNPPTGNITKTSPAVNLNIDSNCQPVPPPTTTTTKPPTTTTNPPGPPPCPPNLPNCQEP